MSDSQSLKDFFAAWTTKKTDDRAALIASVIAEDFYYVDPRTENPITTQQGIDDYIAGFLEMCPPGASVDVVDPVDIKQGHARATVNFVMSAEMKQVGQYFADLTAEGKISRLVGFVGKGAV